MLSGQNILIVSENQLQAIGLRSLLLEYFSPASVLISSTYEQRTATKMDILFISVSFFSRHHATLTSFRKKIVLLLENERDVPKFPSYPTIVVTDSEAFLLEKLETLIASLSTVTKEKQHEELSPRELEVLKLVARGHLNKEIADELSISLHTVISHRKNIIRKLGIKTVPGLTLYALMNGLISPRDIQ